MEHTRNRARLQSATICSIYPLAGKFEQYQEYGLRVFEHVPAPLDHILVRDFLPVPDVVAHENYDGRNLYIETTMPCEKGQGYALYRIYDTVQLCKDLDAPSDRPSFVGKPLNCETVAPDVVKAWAGNTLGAASGSSLGVGVIAGDMPTAAELAALRAGQTACFRWLVDRGNDCAFSGRMSEISDLHRVAARWLGVEKQCKWVARHEYVALKKCPLCQEDMAVSAIKCQACQSDIVADYYLKYKITPSEMEDPGAYEFMRKTNKLPAQPLSPPDKLTAKQAA